MSEQAVIQEIVADLRRLGVNTGGVLVVHSSLRSLGHVPGGPETVIRGLIAALGARGTLLMPALSYEFVTRKKPRFHIFETPSNVGIIPEYFRTRRGTRRSVHPTHSVCGIGRLSRQLLEKHYLDDTPCGQYSLFRLLPSVNGQILMLGCGLHTNTSMHAIEEIVEPPYLFDAPISYQLVLENGKAVQKIYRPHSFVGYEQRYERIEDYLRSPGLKTGAVLKATCYLIEARALWEAALPFLQADPFGFVQEQILDSTG